MAKAESSAGLKAAPDPEIQAPESNGSENGKKPEKPKKPLPTSRISVVKQLDILRGYVHASGQEGKGVKLSELASIMKMHMNTVTLANPFLSDIGLIQRGEGGYVPNGDAIAYAGAHDWNPEKAAHKLAPTIEATWFAKVLMPQLRMRSMEEKEAIAELANEAKAATSFEPQLRMLLEYMEVAGLVIRENGRVSRRSPATGDGAGSAEKQPPGSESDAGQSGQAGKSSLYTSFSQPTEGMVRFNVSFKVDMAEFATWKADRIASFFSGIAQVLAAKGALEKDASNG